MYFNSNTESIDQRINYNNQFLYIHIPKTGGTSVISLFNFKSPTHIKANEIYNSASKHLLEERYSFTIVRHPISRFISLFNYARLDISYYHNNIEPAKALYGSHIDYNLLRKANINECAEYLISGKLKHDESWNHWEPQHTWIFNEYDKLLINKIYKIEDIDSFQKDFSIKLNHKINLPRLNSYTDSNYLNNEYDNLSKKSLELLNKYYEKDFELLNY